MLKSATEKHKIVILRKNEEWMKNTEEKMKLELIGPCRLFIKNHWFSKKRLVLIVGGLMIVKHTIKKNQYFKIEYGE